MLGAGQGRVEQQSHSSARVRKRDGSVQCIGNVEKLLWRVRSQKELKPPSVFTLFFSVPLCLPWQERKEPWGDGGKEGFLEEATSEGKSH